MPEGRVPTPARPPPRAARRPHAYKWREAACSPARQACWPCTPVRRGTKWYPYKGTSRYPYKGTSSRYPYKGTEWYPYKGTDWYPYKGTDWYPYKGTDWYPYKGTTRYPYKGANWYPYKGTSWYPYKGTTRYPYKGTDWYPYKGTTWYPYKGTTWYPYKGTKGLTACKACTPSGQACMASTPVRRGYTPPHAICVRGGVRTPFGRAAIKPLNHLWTKCGDEKNAGESNDI
ncbi:hypothetical protein PCASD_00310 [Puccinia coronata f. sp. avenae]|uniref:Uncharacterized protein n=1 Tax=Puccinia coronata f. sp. avenae TaxID=200324 RepID=A0A2N5VNH0_9BASI|nr:hypothetical protein PCASD_00310 [Puccinia coronata f. sp. avenae]